MSKAAKTSKANDDWYNIPRANWLDKRLSEVAVKLVAKISYELHKNFDNPVFLSGNWIKKVTGRERHQNRRLYNQINHIFNFKYHPKVFVKGEVIYNVFEISYTEDACKIMSLEDVKIESKTGAKLPKKELQDRSKNAPGVEHKCTISTPLYIINNNTVINKEIEKDLLSFSISDNEKLKIKSFEESKSAPSAFSSLELAKDAKVVPKELACLFAPPVFQVNNLSGKTKIISANNNEIHEKPIMNEKETLTVSDRKMLLSKALLGVFGQEEADLLQDNCEFIELEADKIKITIGSKKNLSELEKEKIRKSLKSVYGENVRIVTGKRETQPESVTNCDKLSRPPAPELLTNVRANNSEWFTFRQNLIRVLTKRHEEKIAQHIVKNWFDKLGVSELSNSQKLVMIADSFYIHWIENNYDHVVEEAVCLSNFTVELHYKGNNERPRVYCKELIKRGKK
jgi:F0F1-type ATP synthase delta subunit